jgi:sulfatase modifying factor 1
MKLKLLVALFILALLLAISNRVLADTFGSGANTFSIDFVTIGNPGNAADPNTGHGSVDHAYQIGKYEVTAGQYTEFLNAVAKADPNALYNTAMGDSACGSCGANIQRTGTSPNFIYSVPADWANRPVNYVSFWDAARFANWFDNGQPTGPQGPGTTEGGAYHDVGNQTLFGRNAGATFFIPTEDEWYKAAYHNQSAGLAASYFDYPAGTNTAPINTLPDPGNHANFYDDFGTGNHSFTIGSPYLRTEVGTFANSPSPYGTFDQGGNVFEWNETAISSSRGLRGGSFGDCSCYLQASNGVSFAPTFTYSTMGFRVARSAVPEPSALLLTIAAFATLRTVRRKSVPHNRV